MFLLIVLCTVAILVKICSLKVVSLILLLLFFVCFLFVAVWVVVVGRGGIGGGRELGLGRSVYVSVCWRASVAVCACLSWCRRSDRRACLAALLAVAVAVAVSMVEAVVAVMRQVLWRTPPPFPLKWKQR